MGRAGVDVRAVWHTRQVNLVGVFLGYYGASYLLRYLRHSDCLLRLLRTYQTGELLSIITNPYKHKLNFN